MKLILSTLALGAAATASAIDLNGDPQQAPAVAQTLVPVAQVPAPAPPALAVAADAGLLLTVAPVLAAPPLPTVNSQDDDFDKSAKELEKEIKSLRKQLAKMRKELSKGETKGRRARAPKEEAERARERGELARVRGEEVRARPGQIRERSERQRGSLGRRVRVHEEQADGSLKEAKEQKHEAERRLARVRRVLPNNVKTNDVWVLRDDDKGSKKDLLVVRGGRGQARGGAATGVPAGITSRDHTIHLGHGTPGEHGSTINIHVDEGDVHIHAGGAQIHTSKGGVSRSGHAPSPKGHSPTLFGLLAPDSPDAPDAPHAGGKNEFFVSKSGLAKSQTGEWLTFSGDGDSNPQVKAWVSSGDGKSKGENIYFFNEGQGNLEEFKFPGGHGAIRIEIDDECDEEDDDDDDDDGDDRDAMVFSFGMTGDGDHAGFPGKVFHLSDLEDMNIDLEGMNFNLEQLDLNLEDMSRNLVLDLKDFNLGDVQIEGIGEVEVEDLHEHIQEAIEEALEGIEDDESVEHVIRGRVIHLDGDAAPSPKSGPNKRFIIRSKKGGDVMDVKVKERKNPFNSNSTTRRASLPANWASQSPPTGGAWRTAAFPAADDELMGLVREIHAEIRAMRAELQELRSEVSNAPRRRGGWSRSTGSSTGPFTGSGQGR